MDSSFCTWSIFTIKDGCTSAKHLCIWLLLISFQTVPNSKQEVQIHNFWIFGHTCWLLYKRNPFVQTRSTNFFVLLEKILCFFLLVRIHFVLFFYLLLICLVFKYILATYPFLCCVSLNKNKNWNILFY